MSQKSLIWVFRTVARAAGISINRVTLDSYLEELGIDSLGMLQLLMRIDEETGVTLNDEEVGKLETVRSLFYILNAKGLTV